MEIVKKIAHGVNAREKSLENGKVFTYIGKV